MAETEDPVNPLRVDYIADDNGSHAPFWSWGWGVSDGDPWARNYDADTDLQRWMALHHFDDYVRATFDPESGGMWVTADEEGPVRVVAQAFCDLRAHRLAQWAPGSEPLEFTQDRETWLAPGVREDHWRFAIGPPDCFVFGCTQGARAALLDALHRYYPQHLPLLRLEISKSHVHGAAEQSDAGYAAVTAACNLYGKLAVRAHALMGDYPDLYDRPASTESELKAMLTLDQEEWDEAAAAGLADSDDA